MPPTIAHIRDQAYRDQSKVKPVTKARSQNPNGNKLDRIDTFVIAGVVTVLGIRAFLAITGYPQLGSDSLHIAHVLYGGLILVIALLLLLLSDRPNKLLAALLGGIGFGFFIDEVGKFVTQDNDYFFEPAVSIMYILFLLIWFSSRLIIVRTEKLPFLSPAEWPGHSWLQSLLVLWMVIQVAAIGCVLIFSFILGFSEASDVLGIARLGLLAAAVYGAFIGLGLFRYWQHKIVESAHTFRGATLFAIVAVYPFIYYQYPLFATGLMTITLLVVLGLSEASLKDVLKKLVVKQ